jgi:hypothetical protein
LLVEPRENREASDVGEQTLFLQHVLIAGTFI